MMHDVLVIGGGYAGMAAALQLLRARRRVAVIDAGVRRNRFASHAHGFLGQDGVPPARIAEDAREQLLRYPELSWIADEALALTGQQDAFAVDMRNGTPVQGRRVLLATGVRDTLPMIEGLQDRWGQSVFHCPYCHGYELNQGQNGVIASGSTSLHQAELLSDWGTVTFFPNGALPLDVPSRQALTQRGVMIEDTAIARLEDEASLRLADGRLKTFAGLFVVPSVSPASPLAQQIGCEIEETSLGTLIRTDTSKQTSLAGIYACGDVASMPHSVLACRGRRRDGRGTDPSLVGLARDLIHRWRRDRNRLVRRDVQSQPAPKGNAPQTPLSKDRPR